MPDFAALDAEALAMITRTVAVVDDHALAAPTPCEGWTVADLVRHMNSRHEEVANHVLGSRHPASDDPRADFPVFADRWLQAMARTGPTVYLPGFGKHIPTEYVLSVHFVDMLAHHWDLCRAMDIPPAVPAELTGPALPVARDITAPGSPLVGHSYRPPLDEDAALDAIDNLAALLGRAPSWRPAERRAEL